MFTVNVSEDAVAKLHALLEDEDDGYCVRLREYKVGAGWKTKFVLGLSMDEQDEDEDARIDQHDMGFIIENDLITKLGTSFTIFVAEDNSLKLTVAS